MTDHEYKYVYMNYCCKGLKVAGCPDSSVNTSDVVLVKDMQNLAGCGGVVISLLLCIIQYTTVLLLCNGFLSVLNHLPANSKRLEAAWALSSGL